MSKTPKLSRKAKLYIIANQLIGLEIELQYIQDTEMPHLIKQLNKLNPTKEELTELDIDSILNRNDVFCNCESPEKELHYGYGKPVCFKCNKVVKSKTK